MTDEETKLAIATTKIFKELGFTFRGEVAHGYGYWKSDNPDCDLLYIFGKTMGTFTSFSIIGGESFEDAWEALDDHGVYVAIKSEEQIRVVLNSII